MSFITKFFLSALSGKLSEMRADANIGARVKKQLSKVAVRAYMAEMPDLVAKSLLSADTSVPSGSEFMEHSMYTGVGSAKVIANYAKDLPRVDVFGEKFTTRLRGVGAAYGYTVQDIRRAALANDDLDGRKSEVAKRAVEEKLDRLYALGDAKLKLPGLLSHANVPVTAVPTGQWTTNSATNAQIVEDLTELASAVGETTNDQFKADTMIFPPSIYRMLNKTLYSPGTISEKTIMDVFLNLNKNIKSVRSWRYCETAGASGTSRTVAFHNSNLVAQYVESQAFEQFAPEIDGLEIIVNCHARCGGTKVHQPLALTYGDDLNG